MIARALRALGFAPPLRDLEPDLRPAGRWLVCARIHERDELAALRVAGASTLDRPELFRVPGRGECREVRFPLWASSRALAARQGHRRLDRAGVEPVAVRAFREGEVVVWRV